MGESKEGGDRKETTEGVQGGARNLSDWGEASRGGDPGGAEKTQRPEVHGVGIVTTDQGEAGVTSE